MFANYLEIQKRAASIEKELKSIEDMEKGWPKGELICAQNYKHYKWYVRDNGKAVYLPKKERKLAQQLALKKYYTLRKKELQRELAACTTYIRRADGKSNSLEKMLNNTEYESLLGKQFCSISKELEEWKKAEYEKNTNYPENLIIKGTQGKWLRSKSEAIIDRILFSKGIPFRYEEKIILGNQILYPDFTIRHPKTGKLYYWEHFGMMDNPEYVNHACQKVKTYCDYGFIPSVHLLLTYETKEQPLEIDRIERMVKEYFL